jgi:phenylacetyl-CoA:acceptor oxidoreductase subunit 2
MPSERARETPERIGVAQKCTYCIERIDYGHANGLTPGVHPDATPACVNACIADALHFGDIEDPDSNVSKLVASHETFRMHEELGTDPGFFYLYARKANGAAPDLGGAALHGSEPGLIRTRGVEPWHQEHWDWKAAGNFMCGGTGAGLLIFAGLAAAFAGHKLFPLGLVALAFVGAGLFLVWLKIGRPWRALYVFRQPGRSWMTREAWVALPLFGAGLAAMWFGGAALALVSVLLAAVFLYCQAMILEQAKGIPAWRARELVPLILATGLAEGGGLYVAATAFAPGAAAAAAVLLVLVALRAGLWVRYRAALARTGAPAKALAALDGRRGLFLAVGAFAPIVLLAAGLVVEVAAAPLFAMAGLSAFLAGFAFKYVVVCRAGYNQGFAISRTPVRGAGHPGPGVKPGWSLP